METCDLYLRQSHARDDSISLEIQETTGRAYATQRGYTVRRVVVDEGVSGYSTWERRPNFPSLLEDPADVIVVYRWSRLSRKRLDQVNLIDLLEKAGTRVESAVEPVDPSTAGGRLGRDQMLLIAAFESDVKSEQWKEALARRVSKGLPKNGGPRYGYEKGDDGKYYPSDTTGPILREAYLRYTAGAGFQALCKDLNDRGVTTNKGKPWGVQSLARALDSGFGAGLLINGKGDAVTYADGAQEPVITKDEWEAYRTARASRAKQSPRRRTAMWHLAGLAVCGRCGGRVIKNGDNVLCSAYHSTRTCDGVWVRKAWLETRVAFWLAGHLEDLPERDVTNAEAENVVVGLENDLAGVLDALGRLGVQLATGDMDPDAYRGAQTILTERREAITRALVEARAERDRLAPITRDEFSRLEVGDVTPGEWNGLLARVIRRVEVHADRLAIVPVAGETVEISRG
jgi:DNA invertase Pin-like site-specific DNA recombinase